MVGLATRAPVRDRLGTDVHVWVAQVASGPRLTALREVLDDRERTRAGSFLQPRDHAGYVTAHALLRTALSWARPDIPCQDWAFGATEYERPTLRGPVTDICFSLSHGTHRVGVILAAGHCGIDVERGDRVRDLDLIARTVLAPAELAAYERMSDPVRRRRYFFRLWTLKESYTKARGLGLRVPFDSIEFGLDPITLVDHTIGPAPAPGWVFGQWWAGGRDAVAIAYRLRVGIPQPIVIHHERAGCPTESPPTRTGGAHA